MYPLSDKDLDRLSREAAEQFAVEPHASGWDQLASKLDKELPEQKEDKKRRALWLLLVLLLTCGGGLFWLLSGNGTTTQPIASTSPSQETITKNSSSKETNTRSSTTTTASDKEVNKNIPSEPNAATIETNEPAATNTTDITVPSKTNAETNSVTASVEKSKNAGWQKETAPANQKQASIAKSKGTFVPSIALQTKSKKTTRKNTSNSTGIADNDIVKNNTTTPAQTSTNNSNNNNGTIVSPPVTDIVSENDKAAATVAPIITTEKPSTAKSATDSVANNTIASTTKKAPAKKGNPSEKGLSIGITAGFDYSRINNVGDNKPGYNFGLQVSYALSKRWSFNTGFILTKKNYTANGSDFHPPKHYWTTYIALNDVEGNCQMWDIPLNIRYNLTTSKTKWFISSGFSTYIMRKQDYNYYYTVNNTPREKAWSMNSQTNYWFNVLNISAGVEKQLNRTWSLQAEPFVKAPLKGVGFGNMSINSYGVLATLKFHPVFKH